MQWNLLCGNINQTGPSPPSRGETFNMASSKEDLMLVVAMLLLEEEEENQSKKKENNVGYDRGC